MDAVASTRLGSRPTLTGKRWTAVGLTICIRTRRYASPTTRAIQRPRPVRLPDCHRRRRIREENKRSNRRPSVSRSWTFRTTRHELWLTCRKDGTFHTPSADHHAASDVDAMIPVIPPLFFPTSAVTGKVATTLWLDGSDFQLRKRRRPKAIMADR
jgi:hypothetical protein